MNRKRFRRLILLMTALAAAGCGTPEAPIVNKGPKVTSLFNKGNLANPLNLKVKAGSPGSGRAVARLGPRGFGR